MRLVEVKLDKRGYDITIGTGLFDACARFIADNGYSDGALLVTDERVDALYAEKLSAALAAAGIKFHKMIVPAGEEAKSLKWAKKIYDKAATAKLDRKSPFIALGGGTTGDLTGFASATYMRGTPFIQFPTTLLAQVDSSVGGKVAVNHRAGKNMIGAFHQPDAVFADLNVLHTLSERDYASGLAEVVKCACLTDDGLLAFLLENKQAILARQREALAELVARCCGYKAQIVALDEREDGPRMFLNFGHTYGHAIEAEGNFSLYTHGEAVAIGLAGALLLSERLAGLDTTISEKIRFLLTEFSLPVSSGGLNPAKVYDALWHDKKARSGRLRWILINAPGAPFIAKEVHVRMVMSVLNEIVL